MLKVGYVGPLWAGGTCLERAKVLREHGWEIASFDTAPYLRSGNRILRALQHRLLYGPSIRQFNCDLVRFVSSVGPLDVVWIDKGRWVHPAVLKRIKKITRA